MSTLDHRKDTQLPLELLQTYWASQPRAVRFFDNDLRLLWDNCSNRGEEYPLFQDRFGHPCAIPADHMEWRIWPVQQVASGALRAERFYNVPLPPQPGKRCFRLVAWRMENAGNGRGLIVEEVELVPREGYQGCLEHLDK